MEHGGHDPEAQPSYLWEMLTSPLNINLGMGAFALGGLLALPLGLSGLILPMLAFAAGDAIAALFIPGSPTFRARVDRKYRDRRRERVIDHLRREIDQRSAADDPRWQVYDRLRDRIASLREMARHRRSGVTAADLEKLDDACVDFLGLWLAELGMRERQGAVNENAIAARIAELDRRLSSDPPDRPSLERARADLEEVLVRHQRLASRKLATEAALLALPDAVEEIHHAMVALPASGEGSARLQEAIDRLRLEQELEHGYGSELKGILPIAKARLPQHSSPEGASR
ncbi:MAG TPA: hypothetical protein DDZ76_03060 [Xanthomonadales bacterium]|nr:hypothetical protein [Xanthomonadales bacterium]